MGEHNRGSCIGGQGAGGGRGQDGSGGRGRMAGGAGGRGGRGRQGRQVDRMVSTRIGATHRERERERDKMRGGGGGRIDEHNAQTNANTRAAPCNYEPRFFFFACDFGLVCFFF